MELCVYFNFTRHTEFVRIRIWIYWIPNWEFILQPDVNFEMILY